ncbi:MAG: urease accessory protein UreF [Rhodobacteraceae bacterium]|nr:urease accessory protein UreF [Paracoccaceae bacterium]
MTASLLTLVQWLSPAFPVGSFAYSHGLEWAIEAGLVTDAASLARWLTGVLAEGAGRSDAILLAHAMAPGDPAPLAALAEAMAASRERWAETSEQGAAFLRTTNALTGQDWPAMPLPVAVGVAARGLQAAPVDVVALYLQAFAGALVQAAVRFVPLGQTEGQQVLAGLHPLILHLAAEAITAPLDAIGSGAFGSDLAAMHHETMDTRIFRT